MAAAVDGFVYQPSFRKHKKLMVNVTDGDHVKRIHFGDSRHSHYYDRSGLLPQEGNHLDPKRRRLFLARSGAQRDGRGELTADNPLSANYHSRRVLW